MEKDNVARSLLADIDGRSFLLRVVRNDRSADIEFEQLISSGRRITPDDIKKFFPNWESLNWVEHSGDDIPAGYFTAEEEYCAYLYSREETSNYTYLLTDFENFMKGIVNRH